MTNSDLDDELSMRRYWLHIVGWSLLLCVPLFALGMMLVAFGHLQDGDGGMNDYLMIAGCLVAGGVASYYLWRWFPDFTMGEPQTPRGKRMRWVLVAIVLLSLAISIPILSSGDVTEGPHPLFSNAPVPAMIAGITLAVWGLLLPPLIIFARRNADEHKLQTQDFGMMVGFQTFSIIAPVWWMGHRGGFFPAPDVMIIFIACTAVAIAVAAWKQYV